MQANFDQSVLTSSSTALTVPFQEKVLELHRVIEKYNTKLAKTSATFKHLLIGEPLLKILEVQDFAHRALADQYDAIIEALPDINQLTADIGANLNDINQAAFNQIIEDRFTLIEELITKLGNTEASLESVNNLMGVLATALETLPYDTEKAIAVRGQYEVLMKNLQQRHIETRLNVINTALNEINQAAVIDLEIWDITYTPIINTLNVLYSETQAHQFVELATQIDQLIKIISASRVQFALKPVIEIIDQLSTQTWLGPNAKREKYRQLLTPMKNLVGVLPSIELTSEEQEACLGRMRTAYELTRDAEFLDLISQFAEVVYVNDHSKKQDVANYVAEGRVEVPVVAATVEKKRKKVSFDESSNASKSTRMLTTEDEQEFRQVHDSFINIVEDLAIEGQISRKFGAELLKVLADTINEFKPVHTRIRLVSSYDLLVQAKSFITDPQLISEIDKKVLDLRNAHPELIDPYNTYKVTEVSAQKSSTSCTKFTPEITPNQPPEGNKPHFPVAQTPVLTAEKFRDILQNLSIELLAMTEANQKAETLQELHKAWLSKLEHSKRIDRKFVDKLKRSPVITENERIEPWSDTAIYRQLTTATEAEFAKYLTHLRAQVDKQTYINFITQASMPGYNLVLQALRFKCTKNIMFFLKELKNELSPESFLKYLMQVPVTGFTIIHQCALTGDLLFVRELLAFLKAELEPKMFDKLIWTKNSRGFFASANIKAAPNTARDINELLYQLRHPNNDNTSTNSTSAGAHPDSFYSNRVHGRTDTSVLSEKRKFENKQ